MRPYVIITGGSKGIGAAIAEAASYSYDIALCYGKDHTSAQNVRSRIQKHVPQCQVHLFAQTFDHIDDISDLISEIESQYVKSTPYALIYAAGGLADGLFSDVSMDDHQRILLEHLLFPMAMAHRLWRSFLKQKNGRLIFLSSIAASRAKIGQISYSAAKAGLEGMIRSMALEGAHRGITVNAVAPGLIQTPMTQAIVEQWVQDGLRSKIPVGFVGEGADVAHLVNYLLSPESRYVTGQVLTIDGGRSLLGLTS